MSIRTDHDTRTRVDALKYAHGIFESLDTPVSLSCHILLREDEHVQLVNKSIDPKHYLSSQAFFLDYQSVKLLSKYPYLNTGIDTKAVAREKFVASEARCLATNARFRDRSFDPLIRGRLERILYGAQVKIAAILGAVPKLEHLDFAFGPGAAYGVRGETSVFNKVTSTLECTYAFVPMVAAFTEQFPGWIPEGINEVRVIPGSELTYVLKDAKTDRPICIEPLLNGMFQKGVGSYLRKRLKRHGVNLDDQTVNQILAKLAIQRKLATVDFASASDTFAYLLVMDLLPIDWFEFLDVARCPRYQEDGVWKSFQKFSSMGNAYTFELESLIFYALACACCEELEIDFQTGVNLSVYGDDVIIPQECFDLYAEVTEACGFAVNYEKTFREGVFFESCGHDYFNEELVRPFLLKKRLHALTDSFYAANTLIRLSARIPADFSRFSSRYRVRRGLSRVYDDVVSCIPRHLRVVGPEGYGDGHLVVPLDASRAARHRQYDGWWYASYAHKAIKLKPPNSGEFAEWPMAYALYGTRAQNVLDPHRKRCPALEEIPSPLDNGVGYTVRNRTRLVRTKNICHGTWREYLVSDGWYSSVVE